MARIVLASDMLTSLREATGTLNDTSLGSAELYRALTRGVSDTWDAILSCGIGTEAVKKETFTAVAGTQEYDIDSIVTDGDFYQIRNLYVADSTGGLRPLPRVNPNETYTMRAPSEGATMKLYYFPCAPVFTTGAESFDGINGWEEHAIMCAAIFIKAKKEDDTGQFRARKRELEVRMSTMANRVRAEPPRVVRRSKTTNFGRNVGRGYALPYNEGPRYYDLRGSNIELFS